MADPVPDSEDYADWPTVRDLQKVLGKSRTWIQLRLQSLAAEAVVVERSSGGITFAAEVYAPEVIETLTRLRDEEEEAPLLGDWVTLRSLAAYARKNRRWITAFLEKEGVRSEQRRLSNGQLGEAFPPRAKVLIEGELARLKRETAPPGWLHRHGLTKALDVGEPTVERWLARLGIEGKPMWQPGTGKLLLYFPPDTQRLLLLIKESAAPADEMMSEEEIARELGVTRVWLKPRIKPWRIHAEYRRKNGRKILCYPRRVAERLGESDELFVPAAPVWRLLKKAHDEEQIPWARLTEHAGLGWYVGAVGRRTRLRRSVAKQILTGLISARQEKRVS